MVAHACVMRCATRIYTYMHISAAVLGLDRVGFCFGFLLHDPIFKRRAELLKKLKK